jgi:hypothetical protein
VRRNTVERIKRRPSATRQRNRPETWLFPGLKTKGELAASAPTSLDPEKRREWAERRYETDLGAFYEAIDARLRPGAALTAAFWDGELSFSVDGIPVVNRIFVSAAEGEFIAAQWKVLAATFGVTERTLGKTLAAALRRLAVPDNPAVVQQIVALEGELSALDAEIAQKEWEMNELVERLYELTDAEKVLVRGEQPRPGSR